MKGKKRLDTNTKPKRMETVRKAVGKKPRNTSQSGLRPVSIGKGRKDAN